MILSLSFAAALMTLQDQPYPSRLGPAGRPARPNRDRPRSLEAEAQRVMADYATCLAMRNRPGVLTYLATDEGSEEADRRAGRVAIDECLYDSELRFPQQLLRGALYGALYKIDYARGGLVPARFAELPPITYTSRDPATLAPAERNWVALSFFADCVVRAVPAQAQALIAADVGSPAERSAFAGVQPALGACLTDGVELTFSRPVLRGLIAQSLYRLTVSATPAGPSR